MAKRIVVLSDGTWETAESCAVMEITDEAYDRLCEGEIETCDIEDKDVLSDKEIQ